MTSRTVITVFSGILLALYMPSAASAQQDKQPKQDSKKSSDSMTGCIDEQDGRYVLTNDRDLALLAMLEADGFPTEAFAKHLGHKVTVRGIVIPGGTHPTLKVRSVVAVSDSCTPQQQP